MTMAPPRAARQAPRQPWLHSAAVDGAFLLAPGPLAALAALWLRDTGRGGLPLEPGLWFALVVGIDVAHVYGTLYRTYLDGEERHRLSSWLVAAPLGTWVLGVLLYAWQPGAFWHALAYAAVFHFVRQQYGFLMLYARAEHDLPAWCRRLDQATIYGATVFPLLYWHTHLPRPFSWLIDGDFLALPAGLWRAAAPLYAALVLAYAAKECWLGLRRRRLNVPRNALVAGTLLSWFVGIMLAGGDLAFTLVNVVAHGIPYLALTCIYGRRRELQLPPARRLLAGGLFTPRRLGLALGALAALAFLEEGLWDGLVWREHLAWFPGFDALPAIADPTTLALLVPLLAVPQMTHYLLDGVIWRLRAHPEWRATLFGPRALTGAP
jgi:hypothetical protein